MYKIYITVANDILLGAKYFILWYHAGSGPMYITLALWSNTNNFHSIHQSVMYAVVKDTITYANEREYICDFVASTFETLNDGSLGLAVCKRLRVTELECATG